MNRQAVIISWLAFPLALVYAWLRTWEAFKTFMHELVEYGRIVLPGGGGGGIAAPFEGDIAWRFSLSAGVAVMMTPWFRKALVLCRVLPPEGAFTETIADRLNIAGRWLLAGLLIFMNPERANEGILMGAEGMILAGIFAAVLISPEILTLFSAGFTGFTDALFFPGARGKKPPYSLKLARFYVERQRWDDAAEEYARVLSYHPEQLEAWQERLRVAFVQSGDAAAPPDLILSEGLKHLREPAAKEALFSLFKAGEKPAILPGPRENQDRIDLPDSIT